MGQNRYYIFIIGEHVPMKNKRKTNMMEIEIELWTNSLFITNAFFHNIIEDVHVTYITLHHKIANECKSSKKSHTFEKLQICRKHVFIISAQTGDTPDRLTVNTTWKSSLPWEEVVCSPLSDCVAKTIMAVVSTRAVHQEYNIAEQELQDRLAYIYGAKENEVDLFRWVENKYSL